jgi:neurotransmitter:Na+ symporter, NSS family
VAEPVQETASMGPGTETSRDRGQWSSEPAFVFSMAAAAVGLGNLWRFPYLAGEYGGGGFILAYLVAMAVVCLPLMYLEVAAGRLAQGNTVHTFRQVHRSGAWYGWFVVGLTTLITSYYLVITGWTMGYAVDAVRLDVRSFEEFSAGYASLFWVLVIVALGAVLLVRGSARSRRSRSS